MNTASISIKTKPEIKTKVEEIANEFGVTIADLINNYLKQIVKNKSVLSKFSENPTPYLLESIKAARKERKEEKASPIFDNVEDAVAWLNS